MQQIQHEINIVSDGKIEKCVLLQETLPASESVNGNCRLVLKMSSREVIAEEHDFFEALISIRREIEPEKILLNIYGASINVWPSGMARQMGSGLRAYKMKMGSSATREDLVSIF